MASNKTIDFSSLNLDDTIVELLGNGLILVIEFDGNSQDAVRNALEAYVTLRDGYLDQDSEALEYVRRRLLGKISRVGFDGNRERAIGWIEATVAQITNARRASTTIPAPASFDVEPTEMPTPMSEPIAAKPALTYEQWVARFDQEDTHVRSAAGDVLALIRTCKELDIELKSRLLTLVNERIQLEFVQELGENPHPDDVTTAVAKAQTWVNEHLERPTGAHTKKMANRPRRDSSIEQQQSVLN